MAAVTRYQGIDVARGIAFVAMFVYHAAWFAAARGLAEVPMASLSWVWFQRSIAGSFFFLVGVGLVLANRDRARPGPFLWRLGKLVGGAAVVTAASAVLNPGMLVTFGILHCIAVCSVLGLGLLELTRGRRGGRVALVALGVGAVAISWFSSPVFDGWLAFVGLGTARRATFDFQPLVPWMGVVGWGIAAGLGVRPDGIVASWASSAPPARVLALLGRHTLLLYLAHVPVLVGSVELLAWWRGV